MKAYSLVKEADQKLKLWWNPEAMCELANRLGASSKIPSVTHSQPRKMKKSGESSSPTPTLPSLDSNISNIFKKDPCDSAKPSLNKAAKRERDEAGSCSGEIGRKNSRRKRTQISSTDDEETESLSAHSEKDSPQELEQGEEKDASHHHAPSAEKIKDLITVIQQFLTPAITFSPNLQLPYLLRAKAFAELGLYHLARQDAQKAAQVQPKNRRGFIAEKLVSWREKVASAIPLPDSLKDEQFQKDLLLCKPEFLPVWVGFVSTETPAVEPSDLECTLCLNLLHEPITSPCGHTWCKACWMKTLDHSGLCPLCRAPQPSPSFVFNRPSNQIMTDLVRLVQASLPPEKPLPAPPVDSLPVEQEEIAASAEVFKPPVETVPIFVCSLIFPGAEQGFHIFEPRYRLLVKRAMDKNKRFGICLPNERGDGCKDYGTMVEIELIRMIPGDCEDTPEGPLPRYLIQVKGKYRIRVLERTTDAFGYHEAKVERVYDIEPEDEWTLPTLSSPSSPRQDPTVFTQLVCKTRFFVASLLATLAPEDKRKLIEEKGEMPTDLSRLPFWISDILPLSPFILYQVLEVSSLSKRYELICGWIDRARPKPRATE